MVLKILTIGIYGIASIVSLVLRRENQAVLATLVGFIPTTFGGYGPSLIDARKYHYDFLMSLSYTRWGIEAFYSEEVTPFRQLYQVDTISATRLGYTLDRVGVDFLMMFLLGCGLRIICFIVMIAFNRSKQK